MAFWVISIVLPAAATISLELEAIPVRPVSISSLENVPVVHGVSLQYHTKKTSREVAENACRSDTVYSMLPQASHATNISDILSSSHPLLAKYQINATDVWSGLSSVSNWTFEYRWETNSDRLSPETVALYERHLTFATNIPYPPCVVKKDDLHFVDCNDYHNVICIGKNGEINFVPNVTWGVAVRICYTNDSSMNYTLDDLEKYSRDKFSGDLPNTWNLGFWYSRVLRTARNPGFAWSRYGTPTQNISDTLKALAETQRTPGLCVTGISTIQLVSCDEPRNFICVHEHEASEVVETTLSLHGPHTMEDAEKNCATHGWRLPERYDPRIETTRASTLFKSEPEVTALDFEEMWVGLSSSDSWTHTYTWRLGYAVNPRFMSAYRTSLVNYTGTYPPCLLGMTSQDGQMPVLTNCSERHHVICSDGEVSLGFNLTWAEADELCRKHSSDLFSPHNQSHNSYREAVTKLDAKNISLENIWIDSIVRQSQNQGFSWQTQGPVSPAELAMLRSSADRRLFPGRCAVGYKSLQVQGCNKRLMYRCIGEMRQGINESTITPQPPPLTVQDYNTYDIPIFQFILKVKLHPKLTAWMNAYKDCNGNPSHKLLPQGNHRRELIAIFSRPDVQDYFHKNSINVEHLWSGLHSSEPWSHRYYWHSSDQSLSNETVTWYTTAVKEAINITYPPCMTAILAHNGSTFQNVTLVACTERAAVVCTVASAIDSDSRTNTNDGVAYNVTWSEAHSFCKERAEKMLNLDTILGTNVSVRLDSANISLLGAVWFDRVLRKSANSNFTWRGSNLRASSNQMNQLLSSAQSQREPGLCVHGIEQLHLVDCSDWHYFVCIAETRALMNTVAVHARTLTWTDSYKVCNDTPGYMLLQPLHIHRLLIELSRGSDPQYIGGRGASLDNIWLGLRSPSDWTHKYVWSLTNQPVLPGTIREYLSGLTNNGHFQMCVQGLTLGDVYATNCSQIGDALCIENWIPGTTPAANITYVLYPNVTWLEAVTACEKRNSTLPNIENVAPIVVAIQEFFALSGVSFTANKTWVDRIVVSSHNQNFTWSVDGAASADIIKQLETRASNEINPGKCVAGINLMTLRHCDEKTYFACVQHDNYVSGEGQSNLPSGGSPWSVETYTETTPTKGITCLCTGGCPPDPRQWSAAVKEKVITEILETLEINKTTISATIRKYTSAQDPRPSATAVGSVGIILFVVVFGGLILLDLSTIVSEFQTFLGNIRQFWMSIRHPADVVYTK